MSKLDLVTADFEVDIIDIEIIELYSYNAYEEQREEVMLTSSAQVVSDFLSKIALTGS